MATKVRLGLMDVSSEQTSVNFYVPDLTNANLDALETAIGLLQAEALVISDCAHLSTQFSHVTDIASFSPATESTAHREIALKVTYRDTVNGRVGHLTIPGPTSLAYPPAGTDVVPLSNVVAAAFIAVFEANAVSRDGNAVEVTQVRLIGRNS